MTAVTSRSTASKITAPYVFKVIGKPQDLEPALNIPGGVVQTLEKEQATVHVAQARRRSSWMPCDRRSGLTTLGRPPSEAGGCVGSADTGHEVAGGRRIVMVVRGGNCLVDTDVVKMSGSAGVFIQGSSCPTGGSVSVKGNRP